MPKLKTSWHFSRFSVEVVVVVVFVVLCKEFDGNTDGDTVKFNAVPFPVKTSEVLLVFKEWHDNIALRFELYGCEPGR